MKELIVIIGTIILGVLIFQMMVVEGPGKTASLLDATEDLFTSAVTVFEE